MIIIKVRPVMRKEGMEFRLRVFLTKIRKMLPLQEQYSG